MDKHGQNSPSKNEEESNVKLEDIEVSVPHKCNYCGNQPCIIKDLEETLISVKETYGDWNSNKNLRFRMYSECIKHIHGPGLGKGIRKKLPQCLQNEIRLMAPDEDNIYTGFIESGTK